MIEEVWTARRSSFLPEPSHDQEDEVVDFSFGLHLGMTTAVPEFRAERIAYRDGYERPGEDGVYIDKEYFQKLGLPESLEPAFDSDTTVARVKAVFPVRLSYPLRCFTAKGLTLLVISGNTYSGFCQPQHRLLQVPTLLVSSRAAIKPHIIARNGRFSTRPQR